MKKLECGEVDRTSPTYGLCQCGCGARTSIARHSWAARGRIMGEPHRYLPRHGTRGKLMPRPRNLRGYQATRAPGHPRADPNGYVREHFLVAEKALGRFLQAPAEVHHVNQVRGDNRPCNLVVCQDHAYHLLLHQRLRALRACGHADWRPCIFCRRHDAPALMAKKPANKVRNDQFYHPACRSRYRRALYQRAATARMAVEG